MQSWASNFRASTFSISIPAFLKTSLLVRRTARDFVDDNIIPIIEECFRTERFPRELVPIMGELGFFGANLEGYGCAGMSNVEYGLVMQELERGDSGLRSFVSVQSALVMYPIYTFGSDEQKNTWLPALADRRKAGLLRPHRARLRIEPRRNDHDARASLATSTS